MENLIQMINESMSEYKLNQIVLSKVRKKDEDAFHKVTVKPVKIQGKIVYQFVYQYAKKVFHNNMEREQAVDACRELVSTYFRQVNLFTTEGDYQAMISKKGKVHLKKKPPTKVAVEVEHNRQKKYVLSEHTPYDFLVKLKVMNKEGKVLAKRYDKFKQLNRFLEMVADCLEHLPKERTIHIVDFGCGKSYLTFALYHYLVKLQGLDVQITGLDLKEDVISFCNKTARELEYDGLTFIHGDIAEFTERDQVDMMVTLHACDTATDAALVKAIGWDASVILSVPCCQHELFNQIQNPVMKPMLKHGIIKEKLSSLVTDSMRGNILEIMGYNVQMLEFIDMEHTPKNILIRAFKHHGENKEAVEAYKAFKEFWQFECYLEKALGKDLEERMK